MYVLMSSTNTQQKISESRIVSFKIYPIILHHWGGLDSFMHVQPFT